MKTRAAMLFEAGRKLEIHDVEVQPPRMGEVLVRMAAAGAVIPEAALLKIPDDEALERGEVARSVVVF